VLLPAKDSIDMDTVRAVVMNRMYVMADYARAVIRPVLRQERRQAEGSCRRYLRHARRLLTREAAIIDQRGRGRLDEILQHFANLRIVYEYRQQLQEVWSRKATSQEGLLMALQDWCRDAEATGIQALQDFARNLSRYSLQTA
jgi:stearoyl-CoA desaturase (delta-9 desaturase)